MAKAKKLPSGQWRTLVYSHIDANGKRHYESFTADTKKESEYMAAEFSLNKKNKTTHGNLVLSEVINLYIESKTNVLSPSTINGYRSLQKNYFGEIGATIVKKLTEEQIQVWISGIATSHSPKTIRNIYALLTASIDMFYPDLKLKIRLPQKKKPDLYTPTDKDIEKLLLHIKGTELEIAVLLAAFGPMRRSEICALTSQDIVGNVVNVNKAAVLSESGRLVIKQPKTYSGYRDIVFPQFVIDRLSGISGQIIKASPNQISNRFKRAIKACDLPHFRFHDLRHYSASILHAIGVPDQYIMLRGGWASDTILKSVYRGTMDDQTVKFNTLALQHFEKMQHEMQHKK